MQLVLAHPSDLGLDGGEPRREIGRAGRARGRLRPDLAGAARFCGGRNGRDVGEGPAYDVAYG